MRLSHFALALTIILLAVTGYLAWEAQEEARGARRELELVRRQQAAKEAAMPVSPTTVASLPPPPAPPLAGSDQMPSAPRKAPAAPPLPAAPLTALQKQLLGMPAMAKIVEVHNDQGFAVISAGKNKNLEKGMKFDVRRGDGLVGRVAVGETIEADTAVVDIDSAVKLPGVQIETGDELILPVRK